MTSAWAASPSDLKSTPSLEKQLVSRERVSDRTVKHCACSPATTAVDSSMRSASKAPYKSPGSLPREGRMAKHVQPSEGRENSGVDVSSAGAETLQYAVTEGVLM